MRILGIDPGLDITGYGVIDQQKDSCSVVEAGVIRTKRIDPLPVRLTSIYTQLSELIEQIKPGVCVVEKLYSHYKHPMTAILMGHARGVVIFCCDKNKVPIVDYPAKTVKRAITGNGNASKKQLQRLICKLLELSEVDRPFDLTDALALCMTHTYHTKKGQEAITI
jgi:crossover junction endodeoxyribonuclease RuvC